MGIARTARSLKRGLVSSGTVADESGVAQRETAVARRAMTVDMSSVAARCKTEDDALLVTIWPGEHYQLLPAIVQELSAKTVVEVGTYLGQGTLALKLAAERVITFDVIPWNEFSDTILNEEDFADGIEQRIGDLSDRDYFDSQLETLGNADLIFIDGPKDGQFEEIFGWRLYEALKGTGKAVVREAGSHAG